MKRRQELLAELLTDGFPRRYAGASLKHRLGRSTLRYLRRFPRRYAGASLKPGDALKTQKGFIAFSPALCRGLIEAAAPMKLMCPTTRVFPGVMPGPH